MPNQNTGKIIVVSGGPGTGKSNLVRILSNYYDAIPLMEGEESDFPKYVKDAISSGERILELELFFRNRAILNYLKAKEISGSGRMVILDTFHMTTDIYVNEWIKDELQLKIMNEMSDIINQLLPFPDLLISLFADPKTNTTYIQKRGRGFEQDNTTIQRLLRISLAHRDHFDNFDHPNIMYIDRTNLDFRNPEHLEVLVKKIDAYFDKKSK